MAKRKGPSTSGPRTRSKAVKDRQVESIQRLDKLPKEVWEKILDHLENDDLFPLALSCRYFRQKQKELVARTGQSGPGRGKPRLALMMSLRQKLEKGQPASADYLRFCSKEKLSGDAGQKKAHYTKCLAAFHGHLPLLQKLLKPLKMTDYGITTNAGKSSSQSLHLLLIWLLTCFSLSPLHSARRPTGDLAVAENPGGVQDGY